MCFILQNLWTKIFFLLCKAFFYFIFDFVFFTHKKYSVSFWHFLFLFDWFYDTDKSFFFLFLWIDIGRSSFQTRSIFYSNSILIKLFPGVLNHFFTYSVKRKILPLFENFLFSSSSVNRRFVFFLDESWSCHQPQKFLRPNILLKCFKQL